MRFELLEDRVLVRPHEAPEKSEGGVFVPTEARAPAVEGDVIGAGPGIAGGEPMRVNVGDRIHFSAYAGHRVKIDGETLVCMRQSEILMFAQCQKSPSAATNAR